jgi:hypothetical protein
MKHHRPIVEYIRVPLRCLQTDLPFAVMFATHPRTGRVWFDHISPDNGNSAAPPNRDLRKLPWDGVRCPHCAAGIAVGISVTPTASVTVGATSVTVGVTGVVTMIASALRRIKPAFCHAFNSRPEAVGADSAEKDDRSAAAGATSSHFPTTNYDSSTILRSSR